ncbi:MAG: hypothetical protein HY014_16190 [Acidobacteria bacterium]|nr:hypothetical protein [Acidobacteriota bacterium]MBI3489672.1 hypothetical protein [Acidobacteriota bacterium]
MKGVIIHLSDNQLAAVIACETEDYMVVDLGKPGQFANGDLVDTQGLWFGEHGKILNKTSDRKVEASVQCIVRDLTSARHECDDLQPN